MALNDIRLCGGLERYLGIGWWSFGSVFILCFQDFEGDIYCWDMNKEIFQCEGDEGCDGIVKGVHQVEECDED